MSVAAVMDAVCGGRSGLGSPRLVADQMTAISPLLVAGLRAERSFVNRAAIEAAKHGARQFVQVSCGFPGTRMLHEAAGRERHGARTVYVDPDSAAVAVFDMLTMGDATVAAVVGDVLHPDELLSVDRVRAVLDLSRPVCLVLGGSLAHISNDDDPDSVLAVWREHLAAGSWLVVTHPTPGETGPESNAAWQAAKVFEAATGMPLRLRTAEQVARLLTECELRPPGLQPVNRWRPALLRGQPVPMLGAIATLPGDGGESEG